VSNGEAHQWFKMRSTKKTPVIEEEKEDDDDEE
jgi:hypothetical protein